MSGRTNVMLGRSSSSPSVILQLHLIVGFKQKTSESRQKRKWGLKSEKHLTISHNFITVVILLHGSIILIYLHFRSTGSNLRTSYGVPD